MKFKIYMITVLVSTGIFTVVCMDALPEVTYFTWGASVGVWFTCLFADIGFLKTSWR